jgi:glycosyltransferase involved in cell wall biosynthesis
MKNANVAFVHEWLVDRGGSENVLAAMLDYWPHAPVYTLVQDASGSTRSIVEGHPVITSFLQKLPQAVRHYRSFLPLMPIAVEQFDLSEFDIIISNSYAVAKGVLTGPDQLHICMCCSPIRYAWDLQYQYLRESHLENGLKSYLARAILHYIRLWDVRTTNGVDKFIAISEFIARRIKKVYGRESTVIYPPVDVDLFDLHKQKEDYFLTASRMVPYKRIGLIVEAFSKMPDKRLIVIGDGPDFKKIQARTKSNIELLGYQSTDVLKDYMQRAKAFIFAAEEDFGIVPVEAQACGTPVIAYGRGGALETVIDGKTGLLFHEQSLESLQEAVKLFENGTYSFDPYMLRRSAERFNKERFQREFQGFVESAWRAHQTHRPGLSTTQPR